MQTSKQVTLHRECEAIQIPSGVPVMLPAGSEVRVMQALGGTYTVMTNNGLLVRIAETDRDALGKEGGMAPSTATPSTAAEPVDQSSLGESHTWLSSASSFFKKALRKQPQTSEAVNKQHEHSRAAASADVGATSAELEQRAWEQLQTCFDPEIPVNIVDLGLIYHCRAVSLDAGEYRIEVKFTLTAPGCGMGDILKTDIERKLQQLPGVTEVEVEVVFEPPWNQDMMSDAAKLELGML